jgi:hypothetical protein
MTYQELFNLEQSVNKVITAYAETRTRLDTSYHLAGSIIRDLLEKAPEALRMYITGGKTLFLRDMCMAIGYGYWDSLDNSNAIDFIDSAFANYRHLAPE